MHSEIQRNRLYNSQFEKIEAILSKIERVLVFLGLGCFWGGSRWPFSPNKSSVQAKDHIQPNNNHQNNNFVIKVES